MLKRFALDPSIGDGRCFFDLSGCFKLKKIFLNDDIRSWMFEPFFLS